MLFKTNFFIAYFIIACLAVSAHSQIVDAPDDTVAGIHVNYTEAKVGTYTLPDPLTCMDGQLVKDADTWRNKRRAEIVDLFEQHQFGVSPAAPADIRFTLHEQDADALDGTAKRTQATIFFADNADDPKMDILLYVPSDATAPVPVLLYIAFSPNSMVIDDPGIRQGFIWNREHQKVPAPKSRGFERLNISTVLERGFGLATVYYGDIEPDFAGGAQHGIRSLFPADEENKPDAWGSIGAWSWGLSRALDYFEKENAVDASRVAVMGVSRLGKTVLWAGAMDERFALIIPVCSGESGAALSRRDYGENIAHISAPSRYFYWFAPRYQQYGQNVAALPVDSHMLISLIAPRPVLLITGNTDKWSDPYGEFLAAVAAEPVYNLLGKQGLNTETCPPAGEPILNDIGFYLHDGGHGMDPSDWTVLLDFLQQHLSASK